MYEQSYTVLKNEILENYHEIGLTNQQFLFIVHLMSLQQRGEYFPSPQILATRLGCETSEIYLLLNELISAHYIDIISHKNKQSQVEERYSLSPLYERYERLKQQTEDERETAEQKDSEFEVFEMIQTEFGRALSPVELQQISEWFRSDHYKPQIIKEAIKVAVLNNVHNLRYIDRVLLNWEKNKNQPEVSHTTHRTVNGKLPPASVKKVILKEESNNKK